MNHIDEGGEKLQEGPDLISRIARRALAALPKLSLPLDAQSPISPVDFFDEAPPPCDVPDDEEFLDLLESMRFAGDTRGIALSFVGELAATAAIYARSVARLVDHLLSEKPQLLADVVSVNLDGDGELKGVISGLCEAIDAVNDTGVEHG